MPALLHSLPALLFSRSALTEQGAETIAYITTKKHNNGKAKTSKQEQKSRSGYYIKIPKQTKRKAKEKSKSIYYTIHANKSKGKEKQTRKAKQDKKKSKRDPRKAYKQTSKEGKGKAILFPSMPIYRIAIYYRI